MFVLRFESFVLRLLVKLANFTLASLFTPQYNIYKNRVELATFKTSYLHYRRWRKLVRMNTFCVLCMFVFIVLYIFQEQKVRRENEESQSRFSGLFSHGVASM